MTIETKTCTKCAQTKPKTNQFFRFRNTRDYFESQCRECKKLEDKEYRENNRESIKLKKKKWNEENSEHINLLYKKCRKKNSEQIKAREKQYREKNSVIIKIKQKEYREKYKKNPIFMIKKKMGNIISKALKSHGYKKTSRTHKIIGLSNKELKNHFEIQFSKVSNLDTDNEIWMTWENRGNPKDGIIEPNKTWDIDHIIPLSSAITEEDIIRLSHYTNLQPLCSYINRYVKRDKQ